MTRPSQALIDLDALRHNYRLARNLGPDGQAVAVIKADAYGHGAVPVARALAGEAPAFGVACVEEALPLREAGIRQPILLLEGFFHRDELAVAAEQDLWLMVEHPRQVEALLRASLPSPLTVWLKVDTGMHRLGAQPEQVPELYRRLRESDNVRSPVLLATHLARADELDCDFTARQIQRLRDLAQPLDAPLSIANSPGLLGWPESRCHWNRPGFMLYGNSPFDAPHPEGDRLQPVMTLASRVISVREIPAGDAVGYGATWVAQRPSRIATIPLGYGDGYPRTARSGTPVLIDGQRAPLAGRVSMDLVTVDITDVPDAGEDSTVECWGRNLSANEVAANAGTSAYELLTRMPGRLRRVYRGG